MAAASSANASVSWPATQKPISMPTPYVASVIEALRRALVARPRFRVGEHLARDEEEVVADAVQRDAEDQHEHELAGVAVGEQHVARGPREHADQSVSFMPNRFKKNGTSSMNPTSDTWPSVWMPAAFATAISVRN